MSLFNSMKAFVLGRGASNPNDMVINNGLLRVFNQKKPSKFKTIFKDASLSVKPTTYEHQYQLIVTRIFEEGDPELDSEHIDGPDQERVFLIDESMDIAYEKKGGDDGKERIFSWISKDEKRVLVYEFSVPPEEIEDDFAKRFLSYIVSAALERKSAAQVEETQKSEVDELTSKLASSKIDDPPEPQEASSSKAEPLVPPPSSAVLEKECMLYLYSTIRGSYVENQKVKAKLLKETRKGFYYWLYITDVSGNKCPNPLILLPVDSSISPQLSLSTKAFIFIETEGYLIKPCMLKFTNLEDYSEFKNQIMKAIYENSSQVSFDEIQETEKSYVEETYDMGDTDDETESRQDVISLSSDESDFEDKTEQFRQVNDFSDDKCTNSNLAVGYKNNRSFVVRGSKIGVFRNNDDNDLEFDTSINKIVDSKGKSLAPGRALLHSQDSSLILMDPNSPNKIFDLDLEKGVIKQEIRINDAIACSNVFPTYKFAQMDPESTLMGISSNALYRIDSRISGANKVVETELKQFVSEMNFVCAATTQKGEIVVASSNGEIRLFNKLGKATRALLPGLGDVITGLDVSNDGQYILATCENYLLVINTMVQSDLFKRTAFETRFAKDEKPTPFRLTLKPEHIMTVGKVKFTPAKFNAGPDDYEKYIVTSSGQYLIRWNFRQVKIGKAYAYDMRYFNEAVMDSGFKFGQDRSIVVSLPNDITISGQNQFRSPQSFIHKARKSNLKDDIVNSPF